MTIRTLTSLRSQNKKPIRVISSLVIAIGMMFSAIMPFVDYIVKADGPTYYDYTKNTRIYVQSGYYFSCNKDGKYTVVMGSNGYPYFYFVTPEKNTSYWYQHENDTNYYRSGTSTLSNGYYVGTPSSNAVSNTQLTINPWVNGAANIYECAVYYTYGEGASDGEPEINYGSIKDLSYTTRISGLSGDQNHDVISWYPYWDTNENISASWDMEIRVVPGTYTSDTQNGLFALDPTNFVTNLGVSSYVYQGAYTKGEIEVSWLRVKELLSPWQLSIDGLFSFFDGEYWTKKGWMYQARYIDPDNDYTSEWQNIYTITSSSGKGVEDILDPSDGHGLPDFYQNVQDSYNQVFNTTSNVNNTYNNVYYVNNTPYIINPDPEQDPITAEELNEIINNALRKLLQMQGDQITIYNEGDTNTQTTINNNYNVVQELADQDQQLHDYEYQFNSDLETNLDNIDTSPAVLTNNGFLNAANWVRAQYDRVTLNTPFELVIVFALVLGLGLVIIGKLR